MTAILAVSEPTVEGGDEAALVGRREDEDEDDELAESEIDEAVVDISNATKLPSRKSNFNYVISIYLIVSSRDSIASN